MLQAADINGVWSAMVSYPFIILPPWYRTWWAYTLMSVLLISSIGLIFYLWLLHLRRKDAMEKIVTEQQLIALRAQISPHFLQNTFEFIGNRLRIDTTENIVSAIHQVSVYLRQVLYRSDKMVVSLEEEINFIERYWSMQQMLHMNSFTYKISVSEQADVFGVEVLSMMLQPIAENAIKYGITTTDKNNNVALEVT